MHDHPPAFYDDLELVWAEMRTLLEAGVRDRRSPLHVMSLATVDTDGRPHLRSVVLRAVEADLREVCFHTDARSAKAADLSACAHCALALYDPQAAVQIRIEGRARLHCQDEVASDAWENSTTSARRCYAIEPAPGTVLEAPTDCHWADDVPARERFTRVVVEVERIEWLYLRSSGHRRALFLRTQDHFSGHWLVP
jgi:pyridoxamine 5'-phosphate oxidase